MNLIHTGTELAIGVASGASDALIKPVGIFGQNFDPGTLVETGSLVIGGGMQLLMPMTWSNIPEGLADAGLCLLGRRSAAYFLNNGQGSLPAKSTNPAFARGGYAAMYGNAHNPTPARAQTAGISGLPRVFSN